MIDGLAAVVLLAGALLCAIAALGVLRLPDFFMRVHAATKAGVAGCGVVLAGVALADGSPSTAIKVALAVVFLLLTTPIAGHLLGRAAYVGGAPLWRGTARDALRDVLPRGRFAASDADAWPDFADRRPTLQPQRAAAMARAAASEAHLRSVVVALAHGPHVDAVIRQAIEFARQHRVELAGVAIVDAPRLSNVGPVPIGAGWHAQQMRQRRIALARAAAADVIDRFANAAAASGLRWSVRLEEGRPRRILASLAAPGTLIVVAEGGWFDQGVLQQDVDVGQRLRGLGWRKVPIVVLGGDGESWATRQPR